MRRHAPEKKKKGEKREREEKTEGRERGKPIDASTSSSFPAGRHRFASRVPRTSGGGAIAEEKKKEEKEGEGTGEGEAVSCSGKYADAVLASLARRTLLSSARLLSVSYEKWGEEDK